MLLLEQQIPAVVEADAATDLMEVPPAALEL
jgi:hypothetical protein